MLFPVKFARLLRTPIFTEYLWGLLLYLFITTMCLRLIRQHSCLLWENTAYLESECRVALNWFNKIKIQVFNPWHSFLKNLKNGRYVLVCCAVANQYIQIPKIRPILLKIQNRIEWVYCQGPRTTGRGSKIAKTTMRLKNIRLSGFKGQRRRQEY